MIMTDMQESEVRAAFAAGQRVFGGIRCDDEDAALDVRLRELDASPFADRAPLEEAAAADAARRLRDLVEQRPASSLASRVTAGVGRPEEPDAALDATLHARLAAALRGQRHVPLPAGIHHQLAAAVRGEERLLIEADSGDGASVHQRLAYGPNAAPLPAGIHARLAAAVEGRPHVAIPEHAHARLLEARDAAPALPEGIHARLANAL